MKKLEASKTDTESQEDCNETDEKFSAGRHETSHADEVECICEF